MYRITLNTLKEIMGVHSVETARKAINEKYGIIKVKQKKQAHYFIKNIKGFCKHYQCNSKNNASQLTLYKNGKKWVCYNESTKPIVIKHVTHNTPMVYIADDNIEIIKKYLNTPIPINYYSLTYLERQIWWYSVNHPEFKILNKPWKENTMKRICISPYEIYNDVFGVNKHYNVTIIKSRLVHILGDIITQITGWERTQTKTTVVHDKFAPCSATVFYDEHNNIYKYGQKND